MRTVVGGGDTHDGHENSPILVFFSNLLEGCQTCGVHRGTSTDMRGEKGSWSVYMLGIVKLSGIAMIDPQHTGFATGLEPIILGVGQPDSA